MDAARLESFARWLPPRDFARLPPGRQHFAHLPTHNEFCSGALRAHHTHTPFPRDAREAESHVTRALTRPPQPRGRAAPHLAAPACAHPQTRPRTSSSAAAALPLAVEDEEGPVGGQVRCRASCERDQCCVVRGERRPERATHNFLLFVSVLHVWAGFRARLRLTEASKISQRVDTISRVGSPRGKISLTPYAHASGRRSLGSTPRPS